MSFSGSPAKTQFYSPNGAGRDSYIYSHNGGFCPEKKPCKIEDLGKYSTPTFLQQKISVASIFTSTEQNQLDIIEKNITINIYEAKEDIM